MFANRKVVSYMAREEATLNNIMVTQDFLPEHWDWTALEKSALGNIGEMGKIILSRLENGGCEIDEMYAVLHDKDETKLWDENKRVYTTKFTSNHAHFVIKFTKGKGNTLLELAKIIGLESNFIEKPKRGRYAYDNMLSYLTHIKYDKKYQYNVSNVITIKGKEYIQYYSERHEAWMRGRAERSVKDAKALLNYMRDGIAKGTITKDDIALDENMSYVYSLKKAQLQPIFDAKKELDCRKKHILKEQEKNKK